MSLNPPTRIIFLRRKKITDFLLKSLCPLTLVSSGALISHWKFGEYTSLYPYESSWIITFQGTLNLGATLILAEKQEVYANNPFAYPGLL